MIKKTITFEDLEGRQRSEDFYFNLTKAEILELQFSRVGGFAESLEAIVKASSTKDILGIFKTIILKAYGKRDFDNGHFIKTDELSEAFSHSEAFSNLLFELLDNELAAGEFINNLMPANLRAEVEDARRKQPSDFQRPQAAHKTIEVVALPEVAEPSGLTMSMADFRELDSDQASEFLTAGGKIV